MTTVAESVRRSASPVAGDARVARVVVGLIYTAVQLDDGRTGLALTLSPDTGQDCGQHFDTSAPLTGQPVEVLLRGLDSEDPVEVAGGLAAANALVNTRRAALLEGDVRRVISLRPTDRVAMVGYFQPLVEHVRGSVRELLIFERVDAPQGELRPAQQALEELPGCDVALVTATAIINGSIDAVLRAAESCREVVVLGASTPLSPQAFAATPVTCLAGVLVRDPDAVVRSVAEAGGMRRFKPFIDKVHARRQL